MKIELSSNIGAKDCEECTGREPWDKTIAANTQVLEMGVGPAKVSTFHILMDADANYLGGPYNPSADGGTITITAVNPNQNIVGSFDLGFQGTSLKGTFDASWCAAGVEP